MEFIDSSNNQLNKDIGQNCLHQHWGIFQNSEVGRGMQAID